MGVKVWGLLEAATKKVRNDQLVGGALNAAGVVIEAAKADPLVGAGINKISDQLLQVGVDYLNKSYGGAGGLLEKVGSPDIDHLRNMVTAGIAKLQAPAVITTTVGDISVTKPAV